MKTKAVIATLLLTSTFLFSGCVRNNGPLGCVGATNSYLEDLNAYLSNQNKANCERLAKSIKDIYTSCSSLTALDRQEYEDLEDDLDCGSL